MKGYRVAMLPTLAFPDKNVIKHTVMSLLQNVQHSLLILPFPWSLSLMSIVLAKLDSYACFIMKTGGKA